MTMQYDKNKEYIEILNKNKMRFIKRFILVAILAVFMLFFVGMLLWINMSLNYEESMKTSLRGTLTFGAIVYSFIFVLITLNALKVKQKYVDTFKKEILPSIVRDVNPTLKFNVSAGILNGVYNSSYLNISYNTYSSEDLINGYIQDSYIECAEVDARLIEIEKHTGHEVTTKLFIGLFATVVLPKNIENIVQIRSDEIIKLTPNLNVKMDSSEFEKMFDVNTTNKIVAMQIITSEVIENILNFVKESKIPVQLCIVNNMLYLTFETGPMYEANIFADNKSNIYKYYNTTKFVIELIEKIIKSINETSI